MRPAPDESYTFQVYIDMSKITTCCGHPDITVSTVGLTFSVAPRHRCSWGSYSCPSFSAYVFTSVDYYPPPLNSSFVITSLQRVFTNARQWKSPRNPFMAIVVLHGAKQLSGRWNTLYRVILPFEWTVHERCRGHMMLQWQEGLTPSGRTKIWWSGARDTIGWASEDHWTMFLTPVAVGNLVAFWWLGRAFKSRNDLGLFLTQHPTVESDSVVGTQDSIQR